MLSKDQIREYSGISDSACDFRGVVVGLGALGSSIADIWAREYWADWECVDHDVVLTSSCIASPGRWNAQVPTGERPDLNYVFGLPRRYYPTECSCEEAD